MFCPNCGSRETEAIQFCRLCGTNLNTVRILVDNPESLVPAHSDAARQEIGMAIAAKIRQTGSAEELAALAENVLPEIEKFLETPEEKKMRRLRSGSVVSLIGFGATIAFTIVSQLGPEKDIIVLAAFGLVTLFIGLGLLGNGLFFTVPKKSLPAGAEDEEGGRFGASTNELLMPADARTEFSSVTEHTTRHLKRDKR
jgi:hypothetical protein